MSTTAVNEDENVPESRPKSEIGHQKGSSDEEQLPEMESPVRTISIEVPSRTNLSSEESSETHIAEDGNIEEVFSIDSKDAYGFSTDMEFAGDKKRRRTTRHMSVVADPLEIESCICSEDSDVLAESADSGIIDTSFPENPKSELIEEMCLPPSYYTLSAKERLILLFAENFRRQFTLKYPHRRPLVLAVKNECGVQKFVSTTIRPTGFLFPQLIGSLEEIANFVADFIIYEALENPISLPTRLISPDTLLRVRKGNSFEMATLLCSMLIGAGFPALVVSGVARRETTVNDQREVACPFKPVDIHPSVDEDEEVDIDTSKYALREPPDLSSHLEEELERIEAEREREGNLLKAEEERAQQELLDMQSDDRYHGRRTHAWVAIIENAPWSVKPREKKFNEDGEEIVEPPKAFFVEPSTGFRHEVNSKYYIRVESVWNNYNYYINRQEGLIKGMRWDLGNTNDWEHFLPGEPPEMRVIDEISEEFQPENPEDDIWFEKHLDLIPSWVQKLHIGMHDFEERFPNQTKIIHYQNAILDRYSVYSKRDGKVMQLTLFEDELYQDPIKRWEYYEKRKDLLEKIKIDFEKKQIQEFFQLGRPDKLRFYEHSAYSQRPRFLYFYHFPRFDSLNLLEIYEEKTVLHFKKRRDFCYYQEFRINPQKNELEVITDKFTRNSAIPANKDIALRHFYLKENRIFLQFHYEKGAVTASNREFIKPPKPDYGQEVIFDPNCTKGYIANPVEPEPTQVELYFLLLKQLKEEEKLKKEYHQRVEEINKILETRRHEMRIPVLTFSLFDPLRNEAARNIRMKEHDTEQNRLLEIARNDADFLAPYLVLYRNREPDNDESWAAYNACLNDLKTRYVRLLNELQRKYEDLTAEAKALKKFLDKFGNQFDDFDYERLLKEKKDIELNKRMVQQRLNLTHEEAQRKYEKVKESLLNDSRLNLSKSSE